MLLVDLMHNHEFSLNKKTFIICAVQWMMVCTKSQVKHNYSINVCYLLFFHNFCYYEKIEKGFRHHKKDNYGKLIDFHPLPKHRIEINYREPEIIPWLTNYEKDTTTISKNIFTDFWLAHLVINKNPQNTNIKHGVNIIR